VTRSAPVRRASRPVGALNSKWLTRKNARPTSLTLSSPKLLTKSAASGLGHVNQLGTRPIVPPSGPSKTMEPCPPVRDSLPRRPSRCEPCVVAHRARVGSTRSRTSVRDFHANRLVSGERGSRGTSDLHVVPRVARRHCKPNDR
jgi:hypothetical protein